MVGGDKSASHPTTHKTQHSRTDQEGSGPLPGEGLQLLHNLTGFAVVEP